MQDLHDTQIGKLSLKYCNNSFKLSMNFVIYVCDD